MTTQPSPIMALLLRLSLVVYVLLVANMTLLWWKIGMTVRWAGTGSGVGPLDWQFKRYVELFCCGGFLGVLAYGAVMAWSPRWIALCSCCVFGFWVWWRHVFS